MKRQVLGLDINDEIVAAAVVRPSGNDVEIVACGRRQYHDMEDLALMLPELLAEVGWKEGSCVCGISLHDISLRNLTVPFVDRRKIAQILPMELEDQLLQPVGDQLVEFVVTGAEEKASRLLVAALRKGILQNNLDMLNGCGLDPEAVTLRTMAIAEQFRKVHGQEEGFLVLDAGLHSANIAVVGKERVLFVRRLTYPDKVFTVHPFKYDDEGPGIANQEAAMECIAGLCNDIRRSLGLYRLENGEDSLPERVIMTGCMALVPAFREKVESELALAVQQGDLRQESGVVLSSGMGKEWEQVVCDHALALALQGAGKRIEINFRKGEFALQKSFFASRPQLMAASALLVLLLAGFTGYLGFGYRALNARYEELGDRMVNLYKETFPEATRIIDPLVQMKTNVRNVQAPAIATPIFSGDKRSLNILADISERIPKTVEIHVNRFVIDQDSVGIKGTTDTFNNVNLIQGLLRKSPEYQDVDIVSAAVEKDSGLIRFELKLRTAGAS